MVDNLTRRNVSTLPAFPRDNITSVRIVRENVVCKTRLDPLHLSMLSINNIWEDLVAGYNEVDSRPKRNKVRLKVGLKLIILRAEISA